MPFVESGEDVISADELESSTSSTLHSSLSPVTPPSSPELIPPLKPPRASSSPVSLDSCLSDEEEDKSTTDQVSTNRSFYSFQSTSSAYHSALEDSSSSITPSLESSQRFLDLPWNDQLPSISVSEEEADEIREEEEHDDEEADGIVQTHLTLPLSRCSSVLSPSTSSDSIASTIVNEHHQQFPPSFFVDEVRQSNSPSPLPSALPEWAPTRQEVLQMRSYIADTSKAFPYLWQNTVHYIRDKLETGQVCIGHYTIANGLLEVLAEAICSNIIAVLQLLVEEFLPEFRGKSINQLFRFHALRRSSHHLGESEKTSCPLSSLLHIAVRNNNDSFVRTLVLDLDACPDMEDSNGLTPLHLAVMNAIRISSKSQHSWSKWMAVSNIISCLLSEGKGDPNKPSKDGLTPLAMTVRHLLFSETQPQLSPPLFKRHSDGFLQSTSPHTALSSSTDLPRKLVDLLLSHGAIPGASLHRMSFIRSTFTASLQSCTAEELVNRLVPTLDDKECHKLKPKIGENFAVRDVRRCSRKTQSQVYALSGCQLVFQELRQHKLVHQTQPTQQQTCFPPDIGPSYLLLPVVQIKEHWKQSLHEREALGLPSPTTCEAYSFRKELETVGELEEMWKSTNLTDEIVYQSLIIMDRCLGRDDLLTLEMLLLAHNWLISAQQADRSYLLFLRFLESLAPHIEGIPPGHSAEGFFKLIELEHFLSTVAFNTNMGELLLSPLSPLSPQEAAASFNPIEQFPQEYIMFVSAIVPALSSRVSQCPAHQSAGYLPLIDSLISTTIQNAMYLISSRVATHGARGSMVRWMIKTLVRSSCKVFNSDGSSTTILHIAIDLSTDTRLVTALLEYETTKFLVNELRRQHRRFDLPIHMARHPDMIRLLLDHGAHLDAVDSEGRTASEICPSAWKSSPKLPNNLLQQVHLPRLVCLASKAVVRGRVPYQLMSMSSEIKNLIKLHNHTRNN